MLLCADTPNGAAVAEWAGFSPVRVTLRGVDDEAVQACVAAAFGELPAETPAGRILHPLERSAP